MGNCSASGKEELAQLLTYQPPAGAPPWAPKQQHQWCNRLFCPKTQYAGAQWTEAGLSGNLLAPFTPADATLAVVQSCPHWEEAQRVSCNQGEDSKERTFTSIFLLQNTQNQTFPHEAGQLQNRIIKMVFHMDWSVNRLRCQYNTLTINNRVWFLSPLKFLRTWTPKFLTGNKVLLVTRVFFN